MNWIYFVLISSGIWSVTSLIDKIVISKGHIKNPIVYMLSNALMNVLIVFILPFAGFGHLKLADFFIALLSGAAFCAAVAIYYKCVEFDEISKIVILFQLGPIFVLALSFLFLGEVLTKNHIIGFLFLLGAGAIVSYKKSKKTFRLGKAFYYMIVSMFLSSVALVTSKHIFNVTGFWSAFLWLRAAEFCALAVLLAPSIRKDAINTAKAMKPKIKALVIFKMIIDFSAFMFLGYALLNGPVSLITVLGSSILPLFVFLLASACSVYFPNIVKEEIGRKALLAKVVAVLFVIIGIFLVS